MSSPSRARQHWYGVAASPLLWILLLGAPLGGQNRPRPLLIGTGAAYAPFAVESPTGENEGFSFDLASEIARRIGRSGTRLVKHDRADVFDALLARDFEVIVTPTNITPDRARRVRFTEGYMDTGLAFLVFQGSTIRDVADLRGKTVAVGAGSVSDTWASINEAWLGLSVRRYDEADATVSAVINRDVFAALIDLPRATHAAGMLGLVDVAYTLPLSGKFGLAFHPDEGELMKRVERALECMKLDGTLANLHEKWFGFRAGEDTAISTVYAGYGHPGVVGYDPESHVPRCT